jgi:hypothetical protein
MSQPVEQTYAASNAHIEPTTLRVRLDQATGALEFWIGEKKGRDNPRLAKIRPADADSFARWLAQAKGILPPARKR